MVGWCSMGTFNDPWWTPNHKPFNSNVMVTTATTADLCFSCSSKQNIFLVICREAAGPIVSKQHHSRIFKVYSWRKSWAKAGESQLEPNIHWSTSGPVLPCFTYNFVAGILRFFTFTNLTLQKSRVFNRIQFPGIKCNLRVFTGFFGYVP